MEVNHRFNGLVERSNFQKYFVGMRKRCLDRPLIETKGSLYGNY
jgi:hypothetical protein